MYDIDSVFQKCQKCNRHTISDIREKCYLGLKKVLGKFAGEEKVATFATALREQHSIEAKQTGSEKVLKKSFQIIWRFEKLDLSLHPLSP